MEYLNKLFNVFDQRVFVYLPQSAKTSWITFVNYERSRYFNKKRSFEIHPNAINDVNTEELNLYKRTKFIMDKDISYTLYKLTKLMESQKNKNQIVNIGAGQELSIKGFAQKICQITNFDFNQIKFDLSKYVGARSKILSIEKLQKLLPQYKPMALDQGLKETVAWFSKNKEKLLS